MALTLDGSSGLFAKVGAFYKAIANLEALLVVREQDRAYVVSRIREAAQLYLIRAVQDDTNVAQSLESALNEVVVQAIEQSESCDASSSNIVSVTTSLLGSGGVVFIASGNVAKYNVTASGAREWSGTLRCIGQPNAGLNHTAVWQWSTDDRGDPFGATWYRGLGHNALLHPLSAQIDAVSHQQNRTVVVNGGFERQTANVPDNWALDVGTAGTHIATSTDKYIGTNCIRLTGQASSNLTKLRQPFESPSGSPIALLPQTHYYIGARMKCDASTTGVLRMSVEDSGGTEKYSSGVAKDLSTLGTSYENVGFVFYTGDTMSLTNYATIELTTTLNNTKNLYIDEFVISPCFVVPGVLRLTLLETSSTPELNDRATFQGGATRDHLQVVAWERLFDMQKYDLCMPTDTGGSETIVDSISITSPT